MTPQSSSPAPRSATSAKRRNLWRFALLTAIALGVFMLCASVLVAASHSASTRDHSLAPSFTVKGERTMQGAKLSMLGVGWPAGATVTLTGSVPPGAEKPLDFGTARVNAEGEFRATKLTSCTAPSAPDPEAKVTISAKNGDVKVDQPVSAALWHCMSGVAVSR